MSVYQQGLGGAGHCSAGWSEVAPQGGIAEFTDPPLSALPVTGQSIHHLSPPVFDFPGIVMSQTL